MGYTVAGWHWFGAAVATLAGTLTGLLFVAVSIKSSALAESPNLAARAAQTLVLFGTAVIVSILLVAPQPGVALGAELLATSAAAGAAMVIFDKRAGDADSRVARYLEIASPNLLTAILVGVAGLSFLIKFGGGLYWLIPSVVFGLLGGTINAWLFLVRVKL
jgi:hypothetical protein